mgnify:CR=1 FL=1
MGIVDILVVVVAYLLGSLSFAVIVSKAMGMADPRSYGSGNPGATNVLRSGNKKAALMTLIGDALKGAVAVIVAHTDATGTGAARALLDQRQLDALAESPHEVVLYGRISGTTVVRRVP